jgi:hypothetical protein
MFNSQIDKGLIVGTGQKLEVSAQCYQRRLSSLDANQKPFNRSNEQKLCWRTNHRGLTRVECLA